MLTQLRIENFKAWRASIRQPPGEKLHVADMRAAGHDRNIQPGVDQILS